MQLRCTCGHVMSDTTDEIPYKAHVVPDEDVYLPDQILAETVARLVGAHDLGPDAEREVLIDHTLKYMGDRPVAEAWVDSLDRSTLAKVMQKVVIAFTGYYDRTMYECEVCGRLIVEVWPEGSTDPADTYYVTYAPEADRRGVLRSRWHTGRNPMFHARGNADTEE